LLLWGVWRVQVEVEVEGREKGATGTANPTARRVGPPETANIELAPPRHNIGARAVSEALKRLNLREVPGLVPLPMSRSGFVTPDGFMNDSGALVLKAVERWRPTSHGLLVVHDELDLPMGTVNEKEGGGHGGHNGLRDVMMRLGTGDFRRLRIGIGRPPAGADAADYVLATFRVEEFAPLERAIQDAAELIVRFVRNES